MVTKATAENVMQFAVAPAIMGAINLAVVKFGRSFAPFANMGLLSGGLIGVVQGVASRAFLYGACFVLVKKMGIDLDDKHFIPFLLGTSFVANVLSAAALFAISVLAVKAGIMASTLALSGLAILTLANTALSCGEFFLEIPIFEALEQKEVFSKA